MEKNLISVIVPVYKTEKYLDKCVQSIVDQTYKNLEIILVDDGSPDNCPQICDDWAKKDSRIKVIHKENGGVSSARNAGIDAANGDYIGFVDSDDTIESNMYELMLGALKEKGLDVCCCNIKEVDLNGICINKSCPPSNIFTGQEIIINYILKGYFKPACWNKLYDCALIKNNGIMFDKALSIGEDFMFNYKYLKLCRKAYVIENTSYCYFVERPDSLTKNIDARQVERWKNLETIMAAEKDNKPLYDACKVSCYKELLVCLQEIIDNNKLKELRSSYKKIIGKIRQNYSEIIKNDNFGKMVKFKVKLIKINPYFYIIIRKLINFCLNNTFAI